MKTPREALEKIDHTVCLAFNENNNAIFNKDKYEGIDCKDIYEFVECYEVLEKTVDENERYKQITSIILNKGINCFEIFFAASVNEYNICHGSVCKDLSEEEFNLIRSLKR